MHRSQPNLTELSRIVPLYSARLAIVFNYLCHRKDPEGQRRTNIVPMFEKGKSGPRVADKST